MRKSVHKWLMNQIRMRCFHFILLSSWAISHSTSIPPPTTWLHSGHTSFLKAWIYHPSTSGSLSFFHLESPQKTGSSALSRGQNSKWRSIMNYKEGKWEQQQNNHNIWICKPKFTQIFHSKHSSDTLIIGKQSLEMLKNNQEYRKLTKGRELNLFACLSPKGGELHQCLESNKQRGKSDHKSPLCFFLTTSTDRNY